MIEQLEQVADNLVVAVDGDAIRRVLGAIDRLQAAAADAIARFDDAELWDADAATSMTAWLRDHAGMTARSARTCASRAKQTAVLPSVREAWRSGELSSGQVDVMLHAVTKHTRGLFAEHEAGVVNAVRGLSVQDTTIVMQRWQSQAEAVVDDQHDHEPERALYASRLGSRVRIDGELEGEAGEVVLTALRVAETREEDDTRTPAERRADALVDVCRFFLDNQRAKSCGRHRPHLNVIVDADRARVVDGAELDATTTRRLLCDAAVHRVVMQGRSAILDYGTSTRTIPAPLWNAVVIRDEHCRFPGCDRPSTWCEAHHVKHVEHGGPTSIDNLALLCSRHHHRLHKPGWHAKLLPDGTFETTTPDGLTRSSRPPGATQGITGVGRRGS